MPSQLSLLRSRLQASEVRLRSLEAAIAAAADERAVLQKEYEHLTFCIALLEDPEGTAAHTKQVVAEVPVVPTPPKAPPKPKLQEAILASIQAGEATTVGEVCSFLERTGIQAKRDVVNATLYRLARLGFLTRPGPGVYKKPAEVEQAPPPGPAAGGEEP